MNPTTPLDTRIRQAVRDVLVSNPLSQQCDRGGRGEEETELLRSILDRLKKLEGLETRQDEGVWTQGLDDSLQRLKTWLAERDQQLSSEVKNLSQQIAEVGDRAVSQQLSPPIDESVLTDMATLANLAADGTVSDVDFNTAANGLRLMEPQTEFVDKIVGLRKKIADQNKSLIQINTELSNVRNLGKEELLQAKLEMEQKLATCRQDLEELPAKLRTTTPRRQRPPSRQRGRKSGTNRRDFDDARGGGGVVDVSVYEKQMSAPKSLGESLGKILTLLTQHNDSVNRISAPNRKMIQRKSVVRGILDGSKQTLKVKPLTGTSPDTDGTHHDLDLRSTSAYRKFVELSKHFSNVVDAEPKLRLFLLVIHNEGLSTDQGVEYIRPALSAAFDIGKLFVWM